MLEFEKLVNSPGFNKGRNYLPFLKEIKKFYPKFRDDKMTPQYIFSKLYPGKKFNRQIIWNMNSALFNIAEEFLVHSYLKKSHFDRNCHAADELYDRQLPKLYSQRLDMMEDDLNRMGLSEIFFYSKIQLELRRFSLCFLEDQQHLTPGLDLKKGESVILYLLILLSNVVNNIKYSSLLFNKDYGANIPYEFINNLQLDKVINYAKENNFEFTFVMEIYHCLIMTALRPEDFTFFQKAKELYETHSGTFDPRERENLLGVMTNYCVYMVNKGKLEFSRMLFEVNKLQLREIDEMKIKEIGKTFYIQVLRNALSINETGWAEKYIEEYTQHLKHSYQKTMRALAESLVAFKLKEFNRVLEYLSKVKFIDTRDKFYVRSLSLRAYYELGEIPALIYQIDAAKQFVSKNPSLGIMTRTGFDKFLTCIKKLISLGEKEDSFELEVLKKEIENDKSILNNAWLIEKIRELKTNKGGKHKK